MTSRLRLALLVALLALAHANGDGGVQAALQEVRGTLLSKKRELCRLCRDEEHLDSPMAAAQEEYDEMLLELQHQQQELSMLKVEEECAWLTDEEGVIRYLEAVQAAVTAREEELANVLKVRSHTLSLLYLCR